MTIASISMPRWVSYSPNGERQYSYGLHTRCSAVTGTCVPFPKSSDCTKDPSFCNMWRTVGFLTSFGVVVELCAIVSFIVIISGGVQRRAAGWQVAVGVLSLSAIVQCAGMAIVVCCFSLLLRVSCPWTLNTNTDMSQAFLFDHDERFWDGWHLDLSWSLCTASWTILILTSIGMAASAFYLPTEGDYELIPEDHYGPPDDRLLSRISAWDNGFKGPGSGMQYSYQRDQDSMSDVVSIAASSIAASHRRESDVRK